MAKLFPQSGTIISVKAGEAVTKHCAGQLENTGDPAEAVMAGDGEGMGLFLNDADEGEMVDFLVGGVGNAIRGASSVAAGDLLDSDASGHLTPLGTGVGSRRYMAMSLGNPSAAGEIFPVLVVFGIDSDTHAA